MKTPSYQTIALRLAYKPDEQQMPPHQWTWSSLLDPETDDVEAHDGIHILIVRDPFFDGPPILALPFTSLDLLVTYLSQWCTRRQDEQSVDEGWPPIQFSDAEDAVHYMLQRWELHVTILRSVIDPVFC